VKPRSNWSGSTNQRSSARLAGSIGRPSCCERDTTKCSALGRRPSEVKRHTANGAEHHPDVATTLSEEKFRRPPKRRSTVTRRGAASGATGTRLRRAPARRRLNFDSCSFDLFRTSSAELLKGFGGWSLRCDADQRSCPRSRPCRRGGADPRRSCVRHREGDRVHRAGRVLHVRRQGYDRYVLHQNLL
jgi:hypothetical protein